MNIVKKLDNGNFEVTFTENEKKAVEKILEDKSFGFMFKCYSESGEALRQSKLKESVVNNSNL